MLHWMRDDDENIWGINSSRWIQLLWWWVMWWLWLIKQIIMKKTMKVMMKMTMMTMHDTWCMMMHDDHRIYSAAWSEAENPRGLNHFTGCWSVREVKFHEQGSICDDKGWIIIWSYHLNSSPLHIWPVLTWIKHFSLRCFRIHGVGYLNLRVRVIQQFS